MKTRDMIFATVGVLAGCAIGAAAGGRATAQAAPQYAPNPAAPRWQHRCERLTGNYWNDSRLASEIGADGWELAGMVPGEFCFRRPAP